MALLNALCSACITNLTARLKEGVYPEDCEDAFVMAAAFHGAASLETGLQERNVQEFKAGDLSIKEDLSTQSCKDTSGNLIQQAEALMRPYLKDGFCFTGV